MSQRVGSVALTTAAVILSLVVAEITLRQLGYAPRVIAVDEILGVGGARAQPDEVLGWRIREGSFRSLEPGHALMTFGKDGRRMDPSPPKPEDTPKVLVVGCSFTQGEGIPDNEPYPHVIGRELKNLDIINFGTGAYGTYQSLLRMRLYFAAPQKAETPLVIYGLQGHHMMRNVASSEWISSLTTSDGRWLVPPHVRISGDQIIEYKGHPIESWPFETRFATVALAHVAALKVLNRRSWQEHQDALRRLLTQMKDTAAKNKASLLVVNLFRTPPDDIRWMRQEGFDYVDCEHPDVLNVALRVGGTGHPNGVMHQWWGQCLLSALRARGYESSQYVRSSAESVSKTEENQ